MINDNHFGHKKAFFNRKKKKTRGKENYFQSKQGSLSLVSRWRRGKLIQFDYVSNYIILPKWGVENRENYRTYYLILAW